MSRRLLTAGILLLMAASFLAGAWVSYHAARPKASPEKKALYYVDPMHPSYRSDRPGTAPDCGMALEPVYADGRGTPGKSPGTSLPPGTVQIAADKMQAVGVAVGEVGMAGGTDSLRLAGRVVTDESRTFVINATLDGWITGIGKATTGSAVRRNQVLATFYSPEFLSATQALFFALNSADRVRQENRAQLGQQFGTGLKQYRDSLRNLGMGEPQINELIRSRTFTENVDIVSPADGLVISRNVWSGQRFDKGRELYRIADLSRVWILADTYGAEVEQLRPGMSVKVTLPNRGRSLVAKVSPVPPQFDPASRTMKVRLEAANPGLILRPEMFVDLELPLKRPAKLSVPTEAVLDSGLKKTVFVEKGLGIFEPREVETGRTFGSRVEIVSGLKEGERIAVSGTFLLDSESRMKSSAAGISGTPRRDPVCGMYVDEAKARGAGLTVESGGTTYYFCSGEDRDRFLKNPAAKKPMAGSPPPGPARQDKAEHAGHGAPGPANGAKGHLHQGMPMETPAAPAAAPHGSEMKHD